MNRAQKDYLIREAAEAAYAAALKTFNAAAAGTDEHVFQVAHEALKAARLAVVRVEIEYPTTSEQKKRDRLLQIRNRGLE